MDNTLKHFDRLGNEINIGNKVLALVPNSDATYRVGIVKDFKNEFKEYCDVLVEYDDGRLYCDTKYFYQKPGSKIKFRTKTIKSWRFNTNIVKYIPEYF